MTTLIALVLFIIVVALIFDFANGWHDAANSIATVVSTRVLSPGLAVIWAAVFNFVAFLVFGTRVAKTVGGDLINIKLIDEQWQLEVLLCGRIGAIVWVTAAMMRRRRWASSRRCWWPAIKCKPGRTARCRASRCGSSSVVRPPSRWARCRAAGASSIRWVRG